MKISRGGCRDVLALAVLAGLAETGNARALPAPELSPASPWTQAQARTCKQVSSCEEAVRLWCGGYRRADADGDGIPCENICHSREQVDRIRSSIGC